MSCEAPDTTPGPRSPQTRVCGVPKSSRLPGVKSACSLETANGQKTPSSNAYGRLQDSEQGPGGEAAATVRARRLRACALRRPRRVRSRWRTGWSPTRRWQKPPSSRYRIPSGASGRWPWSFCVRAPLPPLRNYASSWRRISSPTRCQTPSPSSGRSRRLRPGSCTRPSSGSASRPHRASPVLQAPANTAVVGPAAHRRVRDDDGGQNTIRAAICAWNGGAASVNWPNVGSALPGYAAVP
jgi:hypothetical protein